MERLEFGYLISHFTQRSQTVVGVYDETVGNSFATEVYTSGNVHDRRHN